MLAGAQFLTQKKIDEPIVIGTEIGTGGGPSF